MMAAADATVKYTDEEIAKMLKELNGSHNKDKFCKQTVPLMWRGGRSRG